MAHNDDDDNLNIYPGIGFVIEGSPTHLPTMQRTDSIIMTRLTALRSKSRLGFQVIFMSLKLSIRAEQDVMHCTIHDKLSSPQLMTINLLT